MGSPMSLSEMSENQRRKILQIITDKTKIDAHHECLVSVSDCEGKVVRGHLIPMAWLRVIAEDSQVMAFAKSPVDVLRYDEEEFLIQVTKRGISQTLIGRFSCEKHEQMFFPVDKKEPDTTDATNLNLLLYRSIIAEIWAQSQIVRGLYATLDEVPNDADFRRTLSMHRSNIRNLSRYKAQVERCLFPEKCATCNYGSKQCKKIVHKTRELRGVPVLAVAQFPEGSKARLLYDGAKPGLQVIANCGITIFPTSGGHTVDEHYFAAEKPIWEQKTAHWPNLKTKSGKALEEAVSLLALDYCENIAINPNVWDKFGEKRQGAIRKRASETIFTPFSAPEHIQQQSERQRLVASSPSEYVPNRRLLNLFRADRY